MPQLFSNILDAISNTLRHLSNADFGSLAVVCLVVVVVGILLLRR